MMLSRMWTGLLSLAPNSRRRCDCLEVINQDGSRCRRTASLRWA